MNTTKPELAKKRRLRAIQVLTILFVTAVSFSLAPQIARAVSTPGNFIFDVSEGEIVIEPDGANLQVTYGGGTVISGIAPTTEITIIGSTTDYYVIVDHDVICNITLDGTNINTKASGIGQAPFYIDFDSIVTLTLSGTNRLVADDGFAGLNVSKFGTLIITGTGSLEAIGGYGSAGIGNVMDDDSGKIFINGGTIDATGGRGGAGIGGGVSGDIGVIVISDSAFIKNARGGGALDGNFGAGAGIGTGGSDDIYVVGVIPVGYTTTGILVISAGVDITRIHGGAADGVWTAGASIGSGGGNGDTSVSYDLHRITFHNNEDPDITQALTYTINGGKSDAVLPTLAHIQLHNPAFTSGTFNNLWYETPFGNRGAHVTGTAFRSTSIFDLYAYGVDREPKTGL